MKTTHTPGPWRLASVVRPQSTAFDTYAEGSDCSSLSGRVVAGDELIATLPIDGKAGFSKVICHKNARLIAAAPELLEALKTIEKFASINHVDEVSRRACFASIRLEAQDAIAKATGGQA